MLVWLGVKDQSGPTTKFGECIYWLIQLSLDMRKKIFSKGGQALEQAPKGNGHSPKLP